MTHFWFFDLDGTLADTDCDIRAAWKATLRDQGLVCPDFDAKFVAGPPIEEMLKTLFPDRFTDAFARRLRAGFADHYDHDGFPETFEYPGIRTVIQQLKTNGAKVAIVTNKRLAGARAIARKFAWDELFDGIFAGDMFAENDGRDGRPVGKLRKPELLAYVLQSYRAAPTESVLVGDTINDFEAARANGVPSIGVAWGYGKPTELAVADRIISAPAELLSLIQ